MKTNIILFFFFQAIVWFLYFHGDNEDQKQNEISQKSFLVNEEINSEREFSSFNRNDYQLILRNDGLFTKIYVDQTREFGFWNIDYTIPSLILKSPTSEIKYRIIEKSADVIRIELINSRRFVMHGNENPNVSDKLFSSSPVF